MCGVLDRIEARGISIGKRSGAIEEAIRLYHEELKLVPSMIIEKIITRYSLDRESAEKYVEEVFGAVLA